MDPAIAAWWAGQHAAAALAAGPTPALPASFDVTVSPREPLQAAIDRCRKGGSVLLLPGAYEGGVVLSKEVHLFGRGEATLLRTAGEGPVITSTAPAATLDGLVVRLGLHAEGEEGNFGILITAGSLLVRHCDVCSLSEHCISVVGASASPTILGCKVHGSSRAGVLFGQGSKGRVEGCDIADNEDFGIFCEDAEPAIIANKIHGSTMCGVCITGRAARLERNQISQNGDSGVLISGGADPTLIANEIHSNKGSGVTISEAKGRLERNTLWGNGRGGIWVEARGDPTLLGNTIRDHAGGNGVGVCVRGSAFGNVVWGGGNKLSGNALADLGGDDGEEAASMGAQPASSDPRLKGLAQDVLVPCPHAADGCPRDALHPADVGAHADTCDWRKVNVVCLGAFYANPPVPLI